MKVLLIGGGILGATHARAALQAGYEVLHLERDLTPMMASARNFGLIWVSGRASGEELETALRARQIWEEIHLENPDLHFRANGSLTLAKSDAELRVMQECLTKSDAPARGWQILDRAESIRRNPGIDGDFLASLWCPLDATVEPDSVLDSMRSYLSRNSRYSWMSGVDIVDVTTKGDRVTAHSKDGRNFDADFLIHCPGADHESLFADLLKMAPIRKVYLQMMNTAPFDRELTTSIADGDSMRYYPAYNVSSLSQLPPQHPVAEANHMQLLLVQRKDGRLTIGDTHLYDQPFPFKLSEPPYQYLHELASTLIGRQLPPIEARWSGVYSQRIDGAICHRQHIATNIIAVTGPGGRGNSLAPAIAERTMQMFSSTI